MIVAADIFTIIQDALIDSILFPLLRSLYIINVCYTCFRALLDKNISSDIGASTPITTGLASQSLCTNIAMFVCFAQRQQSECVHVYCECVCVCVSQYNHQHLCHQDQSMGVCINNCANCFCQMFILAGLLPIHISHACFEPMDEMFSPSNLRPSRYFTSWC